MKQKMKRALWMLVCFTALSVNSALALEVDIDGLTYELSGVSATVLHVASGNTNSTIHVPPTVTYEGLVYTVNGIGAQCFVNIYHHYAIDGPDSNTVFENGKNVKHVDGRPSSLFGIVYGAFISTSNGEANSKANSYIKEVFLPETIAWVGSYAFCNTQIQKVQLSEGIQQIPDYAFNTPNLTAITVPKTLTSIGNGAFYNTKLKEITIPASVTSFGTNIFEYCSLLREITYLGATPPSNWTATSYTYVPSKGAYSTPKYSINNANIIEMITFSENYFSYTGKAPNITWTNNMEGYTLELTMPTLNSTVGRYTEVIPATFTNGEETFTANIPYYYRINPVELTAKVNNASRLYGEENPDFSISYTGFVNDETISEITTQPVATTTATINSNVDEYPVTISGGKANNYTFKYENATLTVKKTPLTISVEDATKKYGEENPTFSLKYSGLKNDEEMPEWETTPTFTTKANQTSEVGVYDVNVTCAPLNYDATIVQGKLSITKAPLTIKAVNATRQYCGKGTEFTYTYSGFVNDDKEDVLTTKPTIQTEATSTSNVGVYTITPAGAQAKNYDISYESGTLSITQVPLTVSAISCSRVYGEENPAFSFAYQGFVNNETKDVLLSEPTASTSANINSNAGTYDIRVSGGRAFNYALNYENGELTIIPRNLKISVGDYERPYNEENPTFTFIYEGLGSKDTGASLQSQPVVRTTATKTSDIGTYPLEVSGAYSPNYTITYSAGTLTVVKAEQTFEWDQDLSNLNVNEQVELQAKASSGLPISYTMETIDGAELYPAGSKTYLECKAPCEFVIKAVQEGNSNYYSTQRIIKNVKISKADDGQEYFITIRMGDGGFLMQPVELEQTYTYTVCADEGWEVNTLTFDGQDMTEQLSDGQFSTPAITGNSELNVVFKQKDTSVKAMASMSEVKVYASNKIITVTGAEENVPVSVYGINGTFITSAVGNATFTLESGVYVVKVGEETFKVRL